MSCVYLAGPIDGLSADAARGWREAVAETLRMGGVSTFSPAHAWRVASADDARLVVTANRDVLLHCDVLFAWLRDGYGFETVREIEFARRERKDVVALLHPDVMASGTRSLGFWDLEIFDNVNAALLWILNRLRPDELGGPAVHSVADICVCTVSDHAGCPVHGIGT